MAAGPLISGASLNSVPNEAIPEAASAGFTALTTQVAFLVFGTIAALAVTAYVLFRIGMRRFAAVTAAIAVVGLANAIYRLLGS